MKSEISLDTGSLVPCLVIFDNTRSAVFGLKFFRVDSSLDPRGRNPDPDPNPVCNTNMKSES